MADVTVPGPAPATITEADLERMLAAAGGDGYLGVPSDTSVAFADSTGMQVKVRANKSALIRGSFWRSGASDLVKSVTANSSGQTRIDRIVLRFSRTTWLATPVIIAGTPGAGPPALTADEGSTGTWDMRMGRFTVINGATTIAAGDFQREDWYLAEAPIMYTLANRPDSARFQQLGIATDQPVSTAPGATLGRWEVYNGTTWQPLTPPTVDNSLRWGGYKLTISPATPAGSPDADRIWIQA